MFEKSTDDLLYQMANDKDVLGRRWAMNELEAKAATEKERIVALDKQLQAARGRIAIWGR